MRNPRSVNHQLRFTATPGGYAGGRPAVRYPQPLRATPIPASVHAPPTSVKRRLKEGKPVVGTWLSLGSITAARLLARTGFD